MRPQQNLNPKDAVFCAFHRGTKATDACSRCGRFMCVRCKTKSAHLCPLCLQQRRPASRLGVRETFSEAWDAFCVHWLRLTLAAAVVLSVPALLLLTLWMPTLHACAVEESTSLSCLPPHFMFVTVAMYTLTLGFLFCGLVRMCQEALEGHRPAWHLLIQPVAGLKIAFIFAFFAAPWWVFTFSVGIVGAAPAPESGIWPLLALCFLGFMALYVWLVPCMFLPQLMVEQPQLGLPEAFQACMQMGHGRRLKILGILLVVGGVQQLTSLCCLLTFPGFVFLVLCQTAIWRALSAPG